MADFFSTLFGGGAEEEAADKNRALLSQYGTTGNAALDTGLAQSTGAVNTGATQAGNYLGQNTGIYGNLGTTGANTLNTGLTNQLGALGQAGQAYAPLSSLAGQLGGSTQHVPEQPRAERGGGQPGGRQRLPDRARLSSSRWIRA